MWSPRQVTHLPPVWIFYFPWQDTTYEGPSVLRVSSERHRATQSLMLKARVLHIKCNMPGPGIEPRSPVCEAGVLITTLLRPSLIAYRKYGTLLQIAKRKVWTCGESEGNPGKNSTGYCSLKWTEKDHEEG